MRQDDPTLLERGFTLIEVLVVLALLAAIVAIVSPTVISQLDRGDATRVAGDLESVSSAVKAFRVDASPDYPGDADDLVRQIDASDAPVDGVAGDYSQGQVNRWAGPYLETTSVTSTGVAATSTAAFTTGFNATVLSDFWLFNSASATTANDTEASAANADWVAVRLSGLGTEDMALVDDRIDDGNGADDGSVRWSTASSILYFLAAQR